MDYKEYKTILSDNFSNPQFFEDKKSKFIGYISHTETIEEVNEFIYKVKSEHPQATHHVFAYSLRQDNLVRYNDDGEPNKTAGVPILDIIQRNNILDCTIVVVRYFGGTLLGTGGLVHAYSKTTSLALSNINVARMVPSTKFETSIDYSFYNSFISLLSAFKCSKPVIYYNSNIDIKIEISSKEKDEFVLQFTEKCSGQFKLKELSQSFMPEILNTTISG